MPSTWLIDRNVNVGLTKVFRGKDHSTPSPMVLSCYFVRYGILSKILSNPVLCLDADQCGIVNSEIGRPDLPILIGNCSLLYVMWGFWSVAYINDQYGTSIWRVFWDYSARDYIHSDNASFPSESHHSTSSVILFVSNVECMSLCIMAIDQPLIILYPEIFPQLLINPLVVGC